MSFVNRLSVVFACIVLSLSFTAFGDAANHLISFSTPGPDKYADGAVVRDGEWYALCWSADGVFEGVNLDCTPVDENDLVVLVAPLAEGGRCPFTVFQIDSKSSSYKTTGEYSVYLLDTRNPAKDAVASCDVKTGRPAVVNGSVDVQDYAANAVAKSSAAAGLAAAGEWAPASIAGGETPAKITAIEILGSQVEITVADLIPGVKYNVKMGETADQLDEYALTTPKTSADTKFLIDAKDAKFFQVVRQPLAGTEEK